MLKKSLRNKNTLYLFWFVCAVILFSSGCSTVIPIQSKTETIVKPELNVAKTEELGNTLILYASVVTKPSIRTTESVFLSKNNLIYPQILEPIRVDGSYEVYNIEFSNGNKGYFCFASDAAVFFPIHPMTGCDGLMKAAFGSQSVKYVKEDWKDITRPQFTQELIYNGKSGSTVKFLYREFSGGMARAPFSQEIQYDLNESSEIGFKGARLEIIESSNRLIKYIVKNYFSR